LDFVFDLNCTCGQALPEAAAKYVKDMKSLSDYFGKDEEGELIESIRQICKIVAPDRILADLDPVYFTEGFGQLFQFLHLRLPPFWTRQDNTAQDKNSQYKTRQGRARQDKARRRDETRLHETKRVKTRQDNARHDKKDKDSQEKQDKTRQDKTSRDETRQHETRHSTLV
jgi:hypothetical protein